MRLRRSPQSETPETIITLIDVVLFLLIFFMLIGRMDANAPFEMSPARAQTGTDMPGGGITISVAEDGRLALDGQAIKGDDLVGAIERRLQSDQGSIVRINADARAPLYTFLPLVGKIEALGGKDIVLVVSPDPDL